MYICVYMNMSAQSCPTLCNPLDYNLPGFSVHGISQARILEWVAISFSRDLPDPGIEPMSPEYPVLAGRFFISVPPGKPRTVVYHPQNNFLVLYSELFITM